MKQIMNEWRRYILSERTSDKKYTDTIQFFTDALTPEFYDVTHYKDEITKHHNYHPDTGEFIDRPLTRQRNIRDVSPEIFDSSARPYGPVEPHIDMDRSTLEYIETKSIENLDHDVFIIRVKNDEPNFKKMWNLYLQRVGKDIFFLSFQNFKTQMQKLRIYVVYKIDSKSGGHIHGTMKGTGEMTLAAGESVNDQTKESIFPIIKDKFYDTWVHEGTHFLNLVRSEGLSFLGSKSKDYTYTDDLEEVQARMISAINDFNNYKYIKALYSSIYFDNQRKFINDFIYQFYEKHAGFRTMDAHKKETQSRIIGRVYTFSEDVKDSDKYKEFVKQMDERLLKLAVEKFADGHHTRNNESFYESYYESGERKRTFLNNFVESYVMDEEVISSLPFVSLLDEKPIGKGFKRQFAKRNKIAILNLEKLTRENGMFGYNDFKDRKEGRKSNTSKTVEL
tara:strand:- start:504 stop:1853 length:1350 start_codon:yes stop_codon:yes gene_type:complete